MGSLLLFIGTSDGLRPRSPRDSPGASCVLHRFDFCKPVGWQGASGAEKANLGVMIGGEHRGTSELGMKNNS